MPENDDNKAAIFRKELVRRIKRMRESYTMTAKNYKGIRFKDNNAIYRAAIGAVLSLEYRKTETIKNILVLIEGLSLDHELVLKGKFDPLLLFLLGQSAKLDYHFETNLDYH